MKTLHLLCICLLITLVFACDKEELSDTQSEKFVKYYANFPEFTAADVINYESGYAVLGTALTADSGTQVCLIRTDAEGNSIGPEKVYGREKNDRAYCLKSLPDGGFIIMGSSQHPVTDKLEVMVIKIDPDGEPVWTRFISEPGQNVEAKKFAIGENGSIYLAGYCTTTEKSKEIWVFAINANGNDLWTSSRTFGYQWDDEASYLSILDDGDLLMTGYISSTGSVNNAYLLKTDAEGSLDAFLPLFSSENKEGCSIIALNNNDFLVLSTRTLGEYHDIALDMIDYGNMAIEWAKSYATPENEVSKDLILLNNKLYILNTKSTSSTRSLISVVTADASGNKLAVNDFGLSTGLTASSFQTTPDGGFIIAGTNEVTEENNTALTLIKTDALLGL